MNTIIEQRNVLRRSGDGDVYSIPERMIKEFVRLDEQVQRTDFCSDEWFEATDNFNKVFESFRKE